MRGLLFKVMLQYCLHQGNSTWSEGDGMRINVDIISETKWLDIVVGYRAHLCCRKMKRINHGRRSSECKCHFGFIEIHLIESRRAE